MTNQIDLSKIGQWKKERNVGKLCKVLFNVEPTPTQCEIIRTIAFCEHKRVAISCMTRYGKTFNVAAATILYVLMNKNKKVLLIAPSQDQTKILRNYIAGMITESGILTRLLSIGGNANLQSEVSKRRLTFINHCEIMTLSAEGSAERLMGWGGDMVILDESCLIDPEVYRSRISRMLGDNPDSVLVELSNPWNRNNHFYEHWINPLFHTIHVGYETALKEGRITEEFLAEQKDELTPLEFQVLYHSDFPDEAEDQLISYAHIKRAINRFIDPKKGRLMISCDAADKGLDKSVILIGREYNGVYIVLESYSEDKSENVKLSAKILEFQRKWTCGEIFIDSIGIGAGVLSMVKAEAPRYCKVTGCHFGMRAANSKRFINKKAEMYFKLRKLFEEDRISIPDNPQLIRELSTLSWEQNLTGKIKIVDPPQKSPDWSDALTYLIWSSTAERKYHVA
jgi:ribosomal protein S17E